MNIYPFFQIMQRLITVHIDCLFEELVVPNLDHCTNMPHQYVWNKNSQYLFLKAFNNTEAKRTMSYFDNYIKSMQSPVELPIDTDKPLQKFNDKLHSVCKGSLKIKQAKPIKRNKSSRHRKWFDKDLASMHSELVRKSKLYSNFPNDPIIRGSFFKFHKIYSKCCKQKYKSFRTSVINKLNSLHDTDPNAYCKLLKELQDDK